MPLLIRVAVTPFNGQIEIRAPDATDYPEWKTGREPAVALPNCVAVATRGDLDGPVTVDVWLGPVTPDSKIDAPVIFTGRLSTAQDALVVGNTIGNEEHFVSVGPGTYRLSIRALPLGAPPSMICFVLEPEA